MKGPGSAGKPKGHGRKSFPSERSGPHFLSHNTVPAIAHHWMPQCWRQSAKRESLANSRGSTRGELHPADGLASVANVELEHRNWSSMPTGPRCPRCERIANEPPTFRASLSPFVEITGCCEQQRVSVLRTWSRRRATLRHAGRQHQPRTTTSLRIGSRYITPLLAPALPRG